MSLMFVAAITTAVAVSLLDQNSLTSAAGVTMTPLLESLCSAAAAFSAVAPSYPSEVLRCVEKTGMTVEQLEQLNFSAASIDDKCFTKCILVATGYLTDDGEPATESVQNDIQTRFPSKYHAQLVGNFKNCTVKADKLVEPVGGRKKVPCKFAIYLSQCMEDKEMQFCHQLRKSSQWDS